MDDGLAPSDSETDLGSGTESESDNLESDEENEEVSPYNRQNFGAQDDQSSSHIDSFVLPNQQTNSKKFEDTQGHLNFTNKTTLRAQLNHIRDKVKMNRQLYVMPCFLKPGKQTFVVQSQMFDSDIHSKENLLKQAKKLEAAENDTRNYDHIQTKSSVDMIHGEQFYFHQVVAPVRREKVPLFAKKLIAKDVDEVPFDRMVTVFKDWKPPTDADLKKMLVHDAALWKINKFVKDEKAYADVLKAFNLNIRKLFSVFITLSAQSSFPGVTWLDFTKFADTCKILGGGVNSSDVDRFFLASAGEMASQGCYRYQFFEAVMRVADLKYYKSGLAKTFAEAFQMLLDKNCFQNGMTTQWQEFREEIWWSYETHGIIAANLKHLQKIWKSHWAPRKKFMNKLDCIELMSKRNKIIHDENKVGYCYGMSKMAVVMETERM